MYCLIIRSPWPSKTMVRMESMNAVRVWSTSSFRAKYQSCMDEKGMFQKMPRKHWMGGRVDVLVGEFFCYENMNLLAFFNGHFYRVLPFVPVSNAVILVPF